jgi:thioredoxin 2
MTTEALLMKCAECGATNRVPVARLGEQPVCGRCQAELRSAAPIELNDANFDAVMAATALPVLVDFWAAWCGPCQMMAPAFAQAATQLAGQALLAKVDSDANPRLSARFGIRSIPTILKMQGGREAGRQTGAVPMSAIVALAQA